MGNSGSASADSSAAAARLSATVFSLLATPAGKEKLLTIGAACRSEKLISTGGDGFSSSSPAFAAIIKTVSLNDPTLLSHAESLPASARDAFWRNYFKAAVVAASEADLSIRPAAAVPTAVAEPVGAVADEEEDELLLLQVEETFLYKLGPRPRADGYTAHSWGLDSPLLTATARVVAHGDRLISISLWERPKDGHAATLSATAAAAARRVSTAPAASGHRLAAVSEIPLSAGSSPGGHGFGVLSMPLTHYLEPVLDSSRYYALRVSQGGRSAVVGIGFRDRQTSFDLRSAVEEHLRLVARQRGLLRSDATGKSDSTAGDVGSATGSGDESTRLAALIGGSSIASIAPSPTERVTLDISHLKLKGASATAGASAATAVASGPGMRLAPPRAYVAAPAVVASSETGAKPTARAAAGDDDSEAWADFAEADVTASGAGAGAAVEKSDT